MGPRSGSDGAGRERERGQALVIFAISLLALIAAAGLLVDGGLGWTARREAQTAADMAALAAIKAKAVGTDTVVAAANLALANGFPPGSVSCAAETEQGVVVNNPPAGGWTPPSGLDPDPNHYIEVIVTRSMDTTFSAAVGQPCWLVSARAVARFAAETTGAPGTAYPGVLATNACLPNAVDISANGFHVTGDVVSNSGIADPGNGTVVTGAMSYSPNPTGCGPYQAPNPSAGDSYTTAPTDTLTAYPLTYTADFASSTRTITNDLTGDEAPCTWWWPGNTDLPNGPWWVGGNRGSKMLSPGILCSAGNITLTESDVSGNVTFVAGGKITQNGSNSTLTAFWDNLLAYSTRVGAPNDPVISFNNGVTFTGIMFAPYGTIRVQGNAGVTNHGALWGQSVQVLGNGWTLDSGGLGSAGTEITTYKAGTLVE